MKGFGAVESFVVGAVGRPGDRTFLIQITVETETLGYVVEKLQVATLSQEALRLLDLIGHETRGSALEEPNEGVLPAFRVSEMHLEYDEDLRMFDVILVPTSDDLEAVEFTVSPQQLENAARAGAAAVAAGRPTCPRCGLAMDLDGHICPASNGDLRDHRP